MSTTLYISPAVAALFGYSAAEWLADRDLWWQQIWPADRGHTLSALVHCLTGSRRFQAEYRFQTKDGRLIWCRDEAMLFHDAKRGAFVVGVRRDVTAQKQTAEPPSGAPSRSPAPPASSAVAQLLEDDRGLAVALLWLIENDRALPREIQAPARAAGAALGRMVQRVARLPRSVAAEQYG
jgi:PAS domain S-box-containing protein